MDHAACVSCEQDILSNVLAVYPLLRAELASNLRDEVGNSLDGRVEDDFAIQRGGLDALAARDIGISRVGEQGRDEKWLVLELGPRIRAQQDVVGQYGA